MKATTMLLREFDPISISKSAASPAHTMLSSPKTDCLLSMNTPFDAEKLTVQVHQKLPDFWPSGAEEGKAAFHIFQSREFMEAWEKSFGTDAHYTAQYVEVQDADGSPIMLVPLCIEARGSILRLAFIDQGHADYNAPVLFPSSKAWTAEAMHAVWAQIIAALPPFDVAELTKMPEHVFGAFNPFTFLPTKTNGEFCHGNDLTRPWAEVEATQSGMKNNRRSMRQLARIGEVELHAITTAPEAARFIKKLILQKQRRYEETKVPGFKENPHALEFLHAATQTFGDSGNLLVFGLQVGDEIVAVSWGLARGSHAYGLINGFESGSWRKYSCGKILVLELMKWLKDNGFAYLDNGYGNEAWKVQSCETSVPLFKAEFSHSSKGQLHMRLALALKWLRQTPVWQKLRPLKWALLRRR